MARGGGTENFLDGGGQAFMGGDKGPMGGGPPPSPPILGNPGKMTPPESFEFHASPPTM